MLKQISVVSLIAVFALIPVVANAVTEHEKTACIDSVQIQKVKADYEGWYTNNLDETGLGNYPLPGDDNTDTVGSPQPSVSVRKITRDFAEKFCKKHDYSATYVKDLRKHVDNAIEELGRVDAERADKINILDKEEQKINDDAESQKEKIRKSITFK